MQNPNLTTITRGILDEIQLIEPFEDQGKKDLDAVVRDFAMDQANLFVIHNFSHGIQLMAEQWPLKTRHHMQAFYLVQDHVPIGQFLLDHMMVHDLDRNETVLHVHHAFVVSYAYIESSFRKLYPGLGYAVYRYLLDHDVVLVSDVDHTVMSKRVWEKLLLAYNVYMYAHRHLYEISTTAPAYETKLTRLVASSQPLK